MKAMIFAAGFGTRLKPLTIDTPKALIRIQNRTMLEWVVLYLYKFGISEIIINTHYLHDKIASFIKSHPLAIPIHISYEQEILGTGGGLFNTKHFWNNSDFLLCNVDILCTANLNKMLAIHNSDTQMVTLMVNNQHSNSMLIVDEQAMLIGWYKNGEDILYRRAEGKLTRVGFCGIHMISPSIFQKIDFEVPFSIIDLYFRLVKNGVRIKTWNIGTTYWRDIGTLDALESAERDFEGIV